MDRKPTSPAHAPSRPSVLGGFFEGAKTGVFNSTVMMSIFAGLSYVGHSICLAIGGPIFTSTVGTTVVAAIPILGFTAIAMSVVASTLFSGALGAKKAYDVTHVSHAAPVRGPSKERLQSRSKEIELSESPSHTRSDWAERTGRSGSRLAHILENGSQEERSRAAAILEAREQESSASASRV